MSSLDALFEPMIGKNKILIRVLDTGVGIKKKKRSGLFGPLQSSNKYLKRGNGLDLILC